VAFGVDPTGPLAGEAVVRLEVSGFFLVELNPPKLNPLKLGSPESESSKGNVSSIGWGIGSSDSVRGVCGIG
jgi:hypothetical protein